MIKVSVDTELCEALFTKKIVGRSTGQGNTGGGCWIKIGENQVPDVVGNLVKHAFGCRQSAWCRGVWCRRVAWFTEKVENGVVLNYVIESLFVWRNAFLVTDFDLDVFDSIGCFIFDCNGLESLGKLLGGRACWYLALRSQDLAKPTHDDAHGVRLLYLQKELNELFDEKCRTPPKVCL